jgi:copper transport protein
MFGVTTSWGHASLAGSSPGNKEVLSQSPGHIHLTFSGKLQSETALHTLQLQAPDGEDIPLKGMHLMNDSRVIMATVPALENGNYTVTYRVVSIDGHPISGQYTFEVAAANVADAPQPAQEESSDVTQDASSDGASNASKDASSSASTLYTVFLYASRIVYFLAFLVLVGWVLWSAIWRKPDEEQQMLWRKVGMKLQLAHVVAFIGFVAVQGMELMGGLRQVALTEFVLETRVGQSWFFTGLITLSGFMMLFRYRIVDALWALLWVGAKTLNGHANAFEPVIWSRVTDGIHLVGASLWAGGLLALVLIARNHKPQLHSFARTFSSVALASFAVMAITGVSLTLLYTEHIADVLETRWGQLLIAKTILVVAVVIVATVLRRHMHVAVGERANTSFRRWLRIDVALMAAIVAVSAVFTYSSPIVERIAFHWHVMGDTVHMSADIPSVKEGPNTLALKIWVPEGEGSPTPLVRVRTSAGTEEQASVQATDIPSEAWEVFPGFTKYTYSVTVSIEEPEQASLVIDIERDGGPIHTFERAIQE